MRPSLNAVLRNRYLLPLLVLCTLALLTCLHLRWSWAEWQKPHSIYGDPLEIYARVKLAAEQPLQALLGYTDLQRLGAPFHGDWSQYPVPDRLVFFVTGLLSRVTGIVAAIKLVAALFYVLCAVSFFLCARYLRWRPEWAFGVALLFAFSNYNIRWAVTLSFNQTFTLPPLVLLCAHATRPGTLGLGHGGCRGWCWLAVLLGVWLGMGNPYLTLFAGLMAAGALGLALLRRCPRSRLGPLAVFLGVLVAVFALANVQYALTFLGMDDESPLVRNYGGSLLYALKPLDWLIPSTEHRLAWAARLGREYFNQSQPLGAYFPGYLGLAGLLGLGLLLWQTFRRIALRPFRPPPEAALGFILLLAFAVPGGLNSLGAFFGLDIFRASQRISIFANIWILFCLGSWLHRRFLPAPRWLSVGLAVVLTGAAWWEQTPFLRQDPKRQAGPAAWNAMHQLAGRLETELGAGAMIFQLPVRQFPEAGPVNAMTDYEHFQPFLANTSLRFSYGPLAGTHELAWQQFVTRLPATEMVAALEASGFAAIWINTRAYLDGGSELVRRLLETGRTELAQPTGVPVRIIRLRPAPRPILPDLEDFRLHYAWADPVSDKSRPILVVLNGWYGLEQDGDRRWRWARRRGEVGVWWPGWRTPAVLRFKAAVMRRGVLELRHAGRTLISLPLTPGETRAVEVPLQLASGNDRLIWYLVGEPAYPAEGDSRRLGFMIEDLHLLPAANAK